MRLNLRFRSLRQYVGHSILMKTIFICTFFEGIVLFRRIATNKIELIYSRQFVEPLNYNTYIYRYDKSWFNKENFRIYFIRNYNSNIPINDYKETEISIYDLSKNEFIRKINPYFKCIEFTHFRPLELFDVSRRYVIFSQTVEYNIEIFDTELNKLYQVTRKPKDWKSLDTSRLKELRNKHNPLEPGIIIREIDDFKQVGSRVTVVRFVNDTTFAVFYTPSDPNEKASFSCFFDLWRIKPNGVELLFSDIKLSKPNRHEKCSFFNFPLSPTSYPPFFYANYAASLRLGALGELMFQPGKTFEQIEKENEDYISNHDIFNLITIFQFFWK